MKRTIWMKRAVVCLISGLILAAAAGGTAFGEEETSTYDRIVNSRSGVTSRVVSQRSRTDDEDEEDDETGRTYREEDRKTGPGAAAEVEIIDDSGSAGPSVEDVSLSEEYHEDFGVYEEALGDRYFLYSNVGNGGITDKPVAVEIPADLSYVMTKDGVEIPYTSGQAVGGRGSYMLTLTGVNDDSLPFSEQTIYRAVFRFRIQEKLPQATEEADEGVEAFANRINQGLFTEETEEESQPEETEALQVQPEETQTEESLGEVFNEDGSLNEEALNQSIEEALGVNESRADEEHYSEVTGLSSYYDTSSGYFKNELLTGASFYTNVANGMVTNNPVTLQTSDPITFTVLRDGEPMEYEPGQSFEEHGSYMIYPSQETAVYLGEYGTSGRPVFHFRIVTHPINDMGIFNAPQGFVISGVSRDGQEVQEGISENRRFCYLAEDGTYIILLRDEEDAVGELRTSIEKDSLQPRFRLAVDGETASFLYQSDDIAYCHLYRNGELLDDSGIPAQVTGSGDYRLEAYDAAGNMGYAEFTVEYHFNMGAILAIVLVILLIVAVAVFVRRVRSQIKVR